jgi:hypothetical protein
MSAFAKFIPSVTEEGSPGPFEKNIPSGLLERTSFREEREGKTKTSQPWDTSLLRIEFLIPKSIATIFNFLEDSSHLFLKSKIVCV